MFIFGTADDVFAMAVRIEENGNAFYQGAAEKAGDPEIKKLFEDLASMEAGHIQAFKLLRNQLPSSPIQSVWDPEGLAESYLQAAADTHVFTVQAAKPRLEAVNTPLEALDMALQFEKDSMMFFLGMKQILPDQSNRSELDKLILQEMDHYRMLNSVKRQLQSGKKVTIG